MAQVGGEPGEPDRPMKIDWPSADYPTLQSAVDALAPGGTIVIGSGVHRLADPVRIEGHELTIRGEGRDPSKKRFTELIGPPPRLVADEEFNILLAPEDARAMFHSIASELRIEKLRLTGFDTALLMENDDANRSGHTQISGCDVTETGRGLTSISTGTLEVHDTEISDTVWHGISIAPRVTLDAIEPGFGVVGYDCVEAGILLVDADAIPLLLNEIQGNAISGSTPLFGSILGDGITLLDSGSELVRNRVSNNARAGVAALGSLLRWEDNQVTFSGAFDLQIDSFEGESAVLDDRGGNLCGCGGPLGQCPTTAGVPQTPGMVGGLE